MYRKLAAKMTLIGDPDQGFLRYINFDTAIIPWEPGRVKAVLLFDAYQKNVKLSNMSKSDRIFGGGGEIMNSY